jgi:deoxyribonuclease-4
MNDPRFVAVPKILETDKGEDLREDVENMRVLRSLIRESRN